jgi:hypothetical protein
MSCNYAEGLSEYENKGRLGAPEKFDTVEEVNAKVEQLVQLVQQAKHIGRAAAQRHQRFAQLKNSVADPGSQIPDPKFFPSQIPDAHQRI